MFTMTLGWLRQRLSDRRAARIATPLAHLGCLFRVDAKVEGMAVAIGGWSPVQDSQGVIRKEKSLWFSSRLTPECAPWALAKGLPARTTSTLELLSSTVALVLLAPKDSRGPGTVGITGMTDSQVRFEDLVTGDVNSISLALCGDGTRCTTRASRFGP